MKRAIWIGGIAVLTAVIFFLGNLLKGTDPHPITGIWKNDFYGACLCGAEICYLFEGGKIVEYSDEHITNHSAGHYEDLGDGRYRVTLHHDQNMSSEWTVRPGSDLWTHPPDDQLGPDRKQARRFYRPEDRSKWEAIISSAPERDAEITAAVDNHKANKSQEASGDNAVLLLREDP